MNIFKAVAISAFLSPILLFVGCEESNTTPSQTCPDNQPCLYQGYDPTQLEQGDLDQPRSLRGLVDLHVQHAQPL